MSSFFGGMFFGAGLFLFGVAMPFSKYADILYSREIARIEKIEEVCNNLGSEPLSYDKENVTCKNGFVVQYSKIVNKDKEQNND